MTQQSKKGIQNDAVDGTKIKLLNNQAIRARNAANSADISFLKVNTSDQVEFLLQPYFGGSPLATESFSSGLIIDSIADGDTTHAPSRNAVFDALAGKQATGNYITALTGDVTATGPGSVAATIANDAVTFAKFQNVATDRLVGRDTAGSGDVEEISVGGGLEFTGLGGIQRSALTGDVTAAAGSNTTAIATNAVDNTKLSDMAQSTIKGRAAGAGTGDPTDLTSAQATAILDTFTDVAKGLVPASGGGTTNFLRADGTFAAPTGSGITQLTGDVTAGPGSGSQVATIANDAVTNAKLAEMAANTIKANATGATANPTDYPFVSTATADSAMRRDANINSQLNVMVENVATTATAAGTTTLTVTSAPQQQFTGTTTQTLVLPNATTLINGWHYEVFNRSTGAVTVNANGGGLLQVLAAGTSATFTLISNGTAAGTWDTSYYASAGGGGSDIPIGAMIQAAPNVVLDGAKYLRCAGQSVLRSSYPNLTALPDGLTTTLRTPAANVTYTGGASNGSGVVMLFHNATDSAHKSTDSGATWATQAIGAATKLWVDVIWMGGSVNKFVAIASDSANTTHAYSSDGTTWTTATTMASKRWLNLAVNNAGTFAVAVNSDDGATSVTTDGTTWSAGGTLSGASNNAKTVIWSQSAGLFLVFEGTTNTYWTSTDGSTWTSRSAPGSLQLSATTGLKGQVASTDASILLYPTNSQATGLWKSTDGIAWSLIDSGNTSPFFSSNKNPRRLGAAIYGAGANGTPYQSLSFDEGLSWFNFPTITTKQTGAGGGNNFAGMQISSTAFLFCNFSYDTGTGSTSGIATVTIDNTKAQLPVGIPNLFIRYV